ncbi:MAG: ABC transporter substrate binding protein [Desulfosarcinaceae bacterium]|nr:ABC transporter substrate binding protein [Desulfosarcinaceae bacterium]
MKDIALAALRRRRIRPPAMLLLAVVLAVASGVPAANATQRVLLLNSYHQGYKWTDDITNGVRSVLKQEAPGVQVHIEYMDTKRVHDPQHYDHLATMYAHKFQNNPFDVIIASDNNAYDFLLNFRDLLFSDVPVVFCGVNYFEPQSLGARSGFTGVNEEADLEAGIELALRLHPDTRRIVVVNDTTPSGRQVKRHLQQLLQENRFEVAFRLWEDVTMETLEHWVAGLERSDLLFYTFFIRDKAGAFYEFDESIARIAAKCPVPIYGAWDFNLGYGIVGGMLTSGFFQGESAGRLAVQVLAGEPAEQLPVVMKSPNRYMFDHVQLQRFNINTTDLPPGSIIINEPYNIYTEHRTLIWAVLLAIILLHFIIFSLVLNILRRRRAETAVKQSEETLRATFESTEDGLLVTDENGRIRQSNLRLQEIWQAPQDLLDSQEDQLLMDHLLEELESPERFLMRARQLQRSGKRGLEELRLKDGRVLEWFSCPLVIDAEQVGRVWSFRDITRRREMEAQLLQAQKMEAVGTLAGGIAHDFNNRLQTISGYTQLLLLDKVLKSEDRHKLKAIDRAAQRACALSEQLLMFSRKIDSKLRPTDLNHEIRAVAKLLERTLPKMIAITLRLDETVVIVNADAAQIEQVLMNLAINASHAMPDGGKLTIVTQTVVLDAAYCQGKVGLSPGHYARLSVIDDGHGIDRAIMPHIFDPFFTTKEPGTGTGLGLSMVHGIIQNHRGHISCTSNPRRGTHFDLLLPALPLDAEAENGDGPDVVALPSGNEHILLVDDDSDNLEIGRSILERFGYQLTTASGSRRALHLFHQSGHTFDLVILDLSMPHMGGLEAISALIAHHQDVKILISSGYGADAIVQEAIEAGAMGFVRKPYQLADLVQTVRRILDGHLN